MSAESLQRDSKLCVCYVWDVDVVWWEGVVVRRRGVVGDVGLRNGCQEMKVVCR